MACASLCIRPTYVLLTTFQVPIYFSMQALKQPLSLLLRLLPGDGMHFSKQFSLTFSIRARALDTAASERSWFIRWDFSSEDVALGGGGWRRGEEFIVRAESGEV